MTSPQQSEYLRVRFTRELVGSLLCSIYHSQQCTGRVAPGERHFSILVLVFGADSHLTTKVHFFSTSPRLTLSLRRYQAQSREQSTIRRIPGGAEAATGRARDQSEGGAVFRGHGEPILQPMIARQAGESF